MTSVKAAPLDPSLRLKFVDAADERYQSCGADVWGDKTPSKAEFVDVILDLMGSSDLEDKELDVFRALPFAEKRRIVLEVGP